jgi:hypothetical protein
MPNYQDYLPDTRPFSQAIQTYATLKGVDRADEELKLRREEAEGNREQRTWQRGITERQEGRADVAARETSERHGLELGKLRREAGVAEDEDKSRTFAYYTSLKELGIKLTPEQEAHRASLAEGMPNTYEGERYEDYERAWTNVKGFVGDLKNLPADGPAQIQIKRDPKNPGRENLFQSVLLTSGGNRRLGAVNNYQVFDPQSGGVVQKQGMVGPISTILVDRETQTVGIGFQIVDPESKEPLFGPDGKPLIVPATQGRSADPRDAVKLLPWQQMETAADEGIAVNREGAQARNSLSPLQQRMADLSVRVHYRDKEAAAELKEIKAGLAYADALDMAIPGMEKGSADQVEAVQMRDLLREGKVSVETAQKVVKLKTGKLRQGEEVAHKGAVKGAEAKAEFVNKTGPEIEARGAIDLKKQQEADAAAMERTKLTEAGANARNAATNAAHIRAAILAAERAKDSAKEKGEKDLWENYQERAKNYSETMERLRKSYSSGANERLDWDDPKTETAFSAWMQRQPEFTSAIESLARSEDAVRKGIGFSGPLVLPPRQTAPGQPKGKEGAIQAVSTHGGKAKADPLGLR